MLGRAATQVALVLAAVVLNEARGVAIWTAMTLQDLVAQSQLIVVGEIVTVRQQTTTQDVASIRIDELLLARPAVSGLSEARLVVPARRGPARSDMVFYKVGERGIWFLRRDPTSKEDLYLADHPQRRKSVNDLAEVQAYLKSVTPR